MKATTEFVLLFSLAVLPVKAVWAQWYSDRWESRVPIVVDAPPGLLARLFPQEPQGRRRKRRTVEAPAIEELEATSGCKVTRPRTRKDAHDAAPLVLPDELFWKCLSFWKSSRDP